MKKYIGTMPKKKMITPMEKRRLVVVKPKKKA